VLRVYLKSALHTTDVESVRYDLVYANELKAGVQQSEDTRRGGVSSAVTVRIALASRKTEKCYLRSGGENSMRRECCAMVARTACAESVAQWWREEHAQRVSYEPFLPGPLSTRYQSK
jgi:hypothetical protein